MAIDSFDCKFFAQLADWTKQIGGRVKFRPNKFHLFFPPDFGSVNRLYRSGEYVEYNKYTITSNSYPYTNRIEMSYNKTNRKFYLEGVWNNISHASNINIELNLDVFKNAVNCNYDVKLFKPLCDKCKDFKSNGICLNCEDEERCPF